MRIPRPWVLILVLVLPLRAGPVDSLVSAGDLLKINLLSEPAVSPDGKRAVYAVRTLATLPSGDIVYRNRLWLVPLDGSAAARPITDAETNAFAPVWHPSGDRVVFVRPERGRLARLWVQPLAEGAPAAAISPAMPDLSSPRWSPDGSMLLFTAAVDLSATRAWAEKRGDVAPPAWIQDPVAPAPPPAPAPAPAKPGEKPAPPPEPSSDGTLAARRTWLARNAGAGEPFVTRRLDLADARESPDSPDLVHVFAIRRAGETPVDVTPGYGSYEHPSWLPDGRGFVCAGPADADVHPDNDPKQQLFTGTLDGAPPAPLLRSDTHSLRHPEVSPDGTQMAFLAQPASEPSDASFGQTCVGVSSIAAPKLRLLTEKLDRAAEQPQWSADGKSVCFAAESGGGRVVHRVAAAGGAVERLTSPDTWIAGFAVGANDLALIAARAGNPGELFRARPNGRDLRLLTAHNGEWLRDKKLSQPERRKLKTPDGLQIDYWLARPTYQEGGFRYPLLLMIHGGPGAMWGPGTPSVWHDVQFFTALGYAVVFANPRGSSGYGRDFQRACFQNWGPGPGADLLAAVDAVVKQEAFIDPDRTVVLGGSYGGYLAAWLISKDARFKAAVAERGVYDLTTFLGEGSAWPLVPWHFGGYPWQPEVRALLDAQSPISRLAEIRTPLLIQQNEADTRTGTAQGELLYRGLKILGRPVEYVLYPRASHNLSRDGEARQRIDRLVRYDEFFQRFIGYPAQFPPPPPPQPAPTTTSSATSK